MKMMLKIMFRITEFVAGVSIAPTTFAIMMNVLPHNVSILQPSLWISCLIFVSSVAVMFVLVLRSITGEPFFKVLDDAL